MEEVLFLFFYRSQDLKKLRNDARILAGRPRRIRDCCEWCAALACVASSPRTQRMQRTHLQLTPKLQVEEYNSNDKKVRWIDIAKALNNSKTALQCGTHFLPCCATPYLRGSATQRSYSSTLEARAKSEAEKRSLGS